MGLSINELFSAAVTQKVGLPQVAFKLGVFISNVNGQESTMYIVTLLKTP